MNLTTLPFLLYARAGQTAVGRNSFYRSLFLYVSEALQGWIILVLVIK